MKKTIINSIICAVALFSTRAIAQNPIVSPGVYIADPSAHVWKDGKVYVYGSKDESSTYYCSWEYHVLSSPDLLNWTVTKHTFASKGENDQVPFNDSELFAPDCQYKDGKYYLYFCSSNKEEGVATSSSPLGPFRDGKKINLPHNGIDPCVFMDDDGQAYYIWGQFSAKMAKLKPNMMEIDSTSVHDNVVTEKEHFFHEGGYMIKRNGIYYFIYADVSRASRPSCLGYSTATSPFGPYTYRGVIIDDTFCDPSNWTNHGSLVEFKGQWYVFYHRATHNSFSMRKPCIEPIQFNPDGTIKEVEMTTQGAAGPLDARKKMDAERACVLIGQSYIKAIAPDNEALVNIHREDKAGYKYMDFGAGVDSVIIQVRPGADAAKIQFALDYPWQIWRDIWDNSLVSIDVPKKTKEGQSITIRRKLSKRFSGVHALWLNFTGNNDNLLELDWFQFK